MQLTFGRFALLLCSSLLVDGVAAQAQVKAAPAAGQRVPNAIIRKIPRGALLTGVASLTLNPDAVYAGQSSTITVELVTAAPAAGATVNLSAAPAALATLSSSIRIPAGQTTGSFLVTTSAGAGNTSVAISAGLDAPPGSLSAELRVVAVPAPLTVQAVVVPATVPAWAPANASVTLSSAAGPGGTTVALSTSNPSALKVPASVVVPAGQTSQGFTVTGSSFAASGSAAVTATVESRAKSASTQVLSGADVVAFSGFPKLVKAGSAVTGTVKFAGIAPTGGVTVPLFAYSNASDAVVPSSVAVPAGQSQAPVTVTAHQNGGFITLYRNAADQATRACDKSAVTCVNMTVVQPPQFQAADLCPTNLVCSLTSGTVAAGGTMYLQLSVWQWPDPLVVTLSSSNPQVVPVPPSVTFQGDDNFADLKITVGTVSTPTTVTITGTCASCVSGVYSNTRSVTLLVNPAVAVSAVSLPQADLKGGTAATGTVTLSWPAGTGGTKVNLSSSNPSLCTVPASITIPAGQTSGSFAVTTQPVPAAATVTISASYPSGTTRTTTLRITP